MDKGSKVEEIVSYLKTQNVVTSILDQLRSELPDNLKFHSYEHTEDVIHESILFAVEDELDARSCDLIGIAAAYHDSGFLVKDQGHEQISARFARTALELDSSFLPETVDLVEKMILDTKLQEGKSGLHQIPTTKLSRYLLDGDLSNFGRTDFFDRAELRMAEINLPPDQFYKKTLNLMESHSWHTESAKRLRQEQKEINIQELRKLVLRV